MKNAPMIVRVSVSALKPYKRNARTHSKKQVKAVAESITRFGWTNPIYTNDDLGVLAGHGRLAAAKLLGMTEVPIVRLSHLSLTEQRAYILADNRLAEKAGWDKETLALELSELTELKVDLETGTGFELPEIDIILDEAMEADPTAVTGQENHTPALPEHAVTRKGDVWILGNHRLVCGDARDEAASQALMGDELADLIFTDPPYNVPVSSHVRTTEGHREFAMAVGEMSSEGFAGFLTQSLAPAAARCRDGSLAFVCMDWRHMKEILLAGAAVFDEMLNLCVWSKTNGGMGSLYRSQHELVFLFKRGTAAHRNNVELGKHGRYRTNVWSYAGVNAFKADRDSELAMHPTVKPVALVEDAIKDVTARNDIVLDPFGGSGTTLIAAQRCGRRARLIELDPLYCDVIVRRYEAYTGKQARLKSANETFETIAAEREQAA